MGYGLSFSGTHLGLGSISTSGTSPQASPLETSFLGTYGETPYVLKIDFDVGDTITVYINPSAATLSPDVPTICRI